MALLAGLCDVIPVVGIIIATAPAALLAFTVSATTGLAVLSLYALYHLVESYYLVPRIYGSSLRLSTLAVILALMVGSALQGLIGAILILPLVAAYPMIERIWLAAYLSPEVIKDHGALAKALTDAFVSTAGSTPAAVQIVFVDVEKSDWAVAGSLCSDPPAEAKK